MNERGGVCESEGAGERPPPHTHTHTISCPGPRLGAELGGAKVAREARLAGAGGLEVALVAVPVPWRRQTTILQNHRI